MTRLLFIFFALHFALFAFPSPTSAHAFGALYNLPVPFWLYLYGAAGALLISFLIIGYFTNQDHKYSDRSIELSKIGHFKFLTAGWLINTLKHTSIFFFSLAVLTGLFGASDSFSNFNMTFFWIIFLLGLTYLSALVGNVYSYLNPWKLLIEWQKPGLVKYPKWLGYWPALALYFTLIWIELFYRVSPFKLSLILVIYTILNFLGIVTFGKNVWFKYCEFFEVFFRLVSKISPITYHEGKVYLHQPFAELADNSAEHFSLLIFILFMLSSTAFDGFHSTLPWIRFSLGLPVDYEIVQQIGLLISPLIFLAIYLILIALMKVTVKTNLSIKELALKFALTLVPIAFVYNVAHYYTLLLTQGQEIIRLVSDPFGLGWNLFGTSGFSANLGIVDAGFVWHSQVVLILGGHIAATYLSHLVAIRIFKSRREALISQIPMLTLMIIYTVTGLWILSQPLGKGL